jgi:hypothetical protein
MLGVCQAIRGRLVVAVMLFALVPFVRQNLLIVSGLLACLLVVTTWRWWLLVPYTVVLGLPLYHNVYYADEFRFLVTNLGSRAKPAAGLTDGVVALASALGSKVLQYLGYQANEDPLTLLIAVLFVPLGTVLGVEVILRTRGWRGWFLVAVAATAIIPTSIMGGAYYPRFVYVNLTIILLTGLAFGGASGHTDAVRGTVRPVTGGRLPASA